MIMISQQLDNFFDIQFLIPLHQIIAQAVLFISSLWFRLHTRTFKIVTIQNKSMNDF